MNCLTLKVTRATQPMALAVARATEPMSVSVGLVCSVGVIPPDFNDDFNDDFNI